MAKFVTVLILGVLLFFSGAWYLGLFPESKKANFDTANPAADVTSPEKLGEYLYPPKPYPAIAAPAATITEPVVLGGVMQAFETEDVSTQLPLGRVLFIGDQVDDSAVLAAGSAAFLAEPYYFATIYAGRQTHVKFYRRHYENDVVRNGQMLGMLEPSKAFGGVLEKIAKINSAEAEHQASIAADREGETRRKTARVLYQQGTITREELGSAELTAIKLNRERVSAAEKVKQAEVEKDTADIDLYLHEIRAVLPYRTFQIKSITRTAGSVVKQLDPVVMTVQNLERLMAEAQIEEQYAAKLERMKHVRATIEPTVIEAPAHEYPGHEEDVTSVAVSRDYKIVSGSEGGNVFVWALNSKSPERKIDHDSAIRVIACSPPGAKENYCLVGCEDGSIHLWDLSDKDDKPVKAPAVKAHGNDARISALAFSPDGKYFASGASDGSIKIWTTEDFSEKYAFVAQNGVEKCHEDAVTQLTFTPQCRLVSASRDRSLRVWHLKEKGAHPDGKALLSRKGNVQQLGVSDDGQWMLFDQASSLKLYSVEKKSYVHTLNLPANASPFETLALLSPEQVRADGKSAGTLMLTAGAPQGRLQLWRTPDAKSRGFEVRQFATKEGQAVTCAAFSPEAGKGGEKSFAVSASGHKIHLWSIPTPAEVDEHRIENVPLTLKSRILDPSTKQTRIGFEIANPPSERFPHGRFEAGRPVVIVIE